MPVDQLRRSVLPTADVAGGRFALLQLLGRAKVTDFEDVAGRVHQQVLWFDVSVHNAFLVDVVEAPHQLVHVQLCEERVDFLVKLFELFLDASHRPRDEVHHDVQFGFSEPIRCKVKCEEAMEDSNYVLVVHFLHNLELAIFHPLVLNEPLHRDDLLGALDR